MVRMLSDGGGAPGPLRRPPAPGPLHRPPAPGPLRRPPAPGPSAAPRPPSVPLAVPRLQRGSGEARVGAAAGLGGLLVAGRFAGAPYEAEGEGRREDEQTGHAPGRAVE